MQHFKAESLISSMEGNPIEYLEFLKVESMSCGIYHLDAGSTDPQQPHDEDEVYYVLNGRAKFTSSGETVDLQSGSTLFVAAKEEHRFHDIEENLTLLVFFAPPESGS